MDNLFFDKRDLKHCGSNVIIGKTVRIRQPELVSIGDNVIIDDFTYLSGNVDIGAYVHIAPGCVMAASKSTIKMHDLSGLSAGCKVYAASSNYVNCGLDMPTIPEEYVYNVIYGPVEIMRFGLLGANTVVLPSVTVPEGMAVAANLIIRKQAKLMPWHVLLDSEGKQIPRRGKEKLLEQTRRFYQFEDTPPTTNE